jgi:hypothetical protein
MNVYDASDERRRAQRIEPLGLRGAAGDRVFELGEQRVERDRARGARIREAHLPMTAVVNAVIVKDARAFGVLADDVRDAIRSVESAHAIFTIRFELEKKGHSASASQPRGT